MGTTLPTLRVLAFEPFDTGSHRAVREAITRHSRHAWTWITLPGRAWKWRMRLGAIELLARAESSGALDRPVDVIFATSLLSLGDLIAGLPPRLRVVPTVLYMHENQAAYPANGGASERDVHFALTNLTSLRCADRVLWNSQWNQRSFEAGIDRILAHAPESTTRALGRAPSPVAGDHETNLSTNVLWPPVEMSGPPGLLPTTDRVLHNAIRVVWPHRWEHDKGPEELLDLARRHAEPLNLRWTILGERYRRIPPSLSEFERLFADRIDAFGFEPDREAYLDHLRRCDWVLSTARHEYFGIAVVEAMLCGCLPWLPERLSYPELLPEGARGLSPLSPPRDAVSTKRQILDHLRPATAPEAVRRLDRVLDSLTPAGRSGANQ